MKISPVNCLYNNKVKPSKTQSFEGLWGKTSRTTDIDKTLYIPTVTETYYYYPFIDETLAEINRVVADNTMADIQEANGVSKYMIKECKICTTLPFKKANFDAYSIMDESSRITKNPRIVHYCVKDKYITNEYGNEQIPAINSAVEKKILDTKA